MELWMRKQVRRWKNILKTALPALLFLNTYRSTSQLARDSLGQIEIPEMVQQKLKEFLKENTRKS